MVGGHRNSPSRRTGQQHSYDRRTHASPNIYGSRTRRAYRDIYETDQAEAPHGGRFRWLMSTCLAGTVGAIAIMAVIYGSTDETGEATAALMPALKTLQTGELAPSLIPRVRRADGLNWSTPKADSMEVVSGATSTRYVIYESFKQRRGDREYIQQKPYARIVARLSRDTGDYDSKIPPFNPFKLYASDAPIGSRDSKSKDGSNGNIKVRVVELLGGILPGEDGQELAASEVKELVTQAQREELLPAGVLREGVTEGNVKPEQKKDTPRKIANDFSPNTTILTKSVVELDPVDGELEGRQKRIVAVGGEDTLRSVLTAAGAENWQIEAMLEPLSASPELAQLREGQQVHITLVPSLTQQDKMEPAEFSVFDGGQVHVITVSRNEAGQFTLRDTPFEQKDLARVALAGSKNAKPPSLYKSIFHASLLQNLPEETIMQILRVHAYQTDFRRRISPGDTVEFFFDPKDSKAIDGPPGELLFTNITAGGKQSRFYRFRTSDGVVDYYDESGNNSKQFLMRRPVRSSDVRLTSGFGLRHHPLLNKRRMHNGVDWAARTGTPILAAGNGVVEHAGRRGHYGKYVRIRHANGYETAYAHMHSIARGMRKGVKVKQGQVIGYVGSTGLSSGPHLHYEVLVNKRFVNPMSIKVPRARQLKGRELALFVKERARIDELMRRSPVKTASK